MSKDITEIEKIFSRYFFDQYLVQWSAIWSFRTLSGFSFSKGVDDYEKYTIETMELFRPGEVFSKTIKDPKSYWNSDEPIKAIRKQVRSTLENSEIMIDCWTLVFAHSVLDDFALKMNQIAFEIDSNLFIRFIEEQKVKVKDVVDDASNSIKVKLDKWIESLENESLLRKVDVIYLVCNDSKKPVSEGNYAFNRKRLEQIDKTRHEIIHSPDVSRSIPNVEDDLHFLFRTGAHFVYLMHKNFGLRTIPELGSDDKTK